MCQIDTGSQNSISNINSAIDLIRGVYGKIGMIPLLLTLEPIEVTNPDDGKKKTVRVLNLRTKGTMLELMERVANPMQVLSLPAPVDTEPPGDTALPIPDDETPDLIIPPEQEPEELFPEETKQQEVESGKEEAEQGKSSIDLAWLRESLKTLRAKRLKAWTEDNVLAYMKVAYKVEGKTVLEAAAKLEKGPAVHFTTRIQDTLGMV